MKILAGTSGFAYKEWKGPFYPEDLADADMLAWYAGRLPTVEINNTFYRMPNRKTVDRWCEQAPDDFSFVLKATRRITHAKGRLADVDELLEYVLETVAPLGSRLGAHLFQLPPYQRRDDELLRGFLAKLPRDQRAAIEFRHESWLDDTVFEVLREHDVALVIADGEKVEIPRRPTASWGYLRLRDADYDPAELRDWADFVTSCDWSRAFVFFKHEDEGAGPALAARFLEVVGGQGRG